MERAFFCPGPKWDDARNVVADNDCRPSPSSSSSSSPSPLFFALRRRSPSRLHLSRKAPVSCPWPLLFLLLSFVSLSRRDDGTHATRSRSVPRRKNAGTRGPVESPRGGEKERRRRKWQMEARKLQRWVTGYGSTGVAAFYCCFNEKASASGYVCWRDTRCRFRSDIRA